MGIPNDKKVKNALAILKDYCMSRMCEGCCLYSMCPYINRYVEAPMYWDLGEFDLAREENKDEIQ